MKLGHIELFVRDPAAARAFYVDVLGFELIAVQADHFTWLAAGALSILLRSGPHADSVDAYGSAPAGIVLYTEDLPGTVAALTARGLAFRGDDGSPTCLTFTDPDGHWFQLVNPNDHE